MDVTSFIIGADLGLTAILVVSLLSTRSQLKTAEDDLDIMDDICDKQAATIDLKDAYIDKLASAYADVVSSAYQSDLKLQMHEVNALDAQRDSVRRAIGYQQELNDLEFEERFHEGSHVVVWNVNDGCRSKVATGVVVHIDCPSLTGPVPNGVWPPNSVWPTVKLLCPDGSMFVFIDDAMHAVEVIHDGSMIVAENADQLPIKFSDVIPEGGREVTGEAVLRPTSGLNQMLADACHGSPDVNHPQEAWLASNPEALTSVRLGLDQVSRQELIDVTLDA